MKHYFTLSKVPEGHGEHQLRLGRLKGYGAVVGQIWPSRRKKVWVGYNLLRGGYCEEAGSMKDIRRVLEADILVTIRAMAEGLEQ